MAANAVISKVFTGVVPVESVEAEAMEAAEISQENVKRRQLYLVDTALGKPALEPLDATRWQVPAVGRVEGRAHDPLLNVLRGGALVYHLAVRLEEHGRVEHVPVEEGHPSLEAVRHRRLVRAQAVVDV